jgi:hypothetical protein
VEEEKYTIGTSVSPKTMKRKKRKKEKNSRKEMAAYAQENSSTPQWGQKHADTMVLDK